MCIRDSVTLCTENVWIDNWKVLDEGNSDHRLLIFTLQSLRINRYRRNLEKEALNVLTGVLPIDLLAKQRKDLYWDKRNGRNRAHIIKGESISIWQDRWDNSSKGRALYLKIPDVKERIRIKLEFNHYGTQYLKMCIRDRDRVVVK